MVVSLPHPWTPMPDYAITGCWMIAPPVTHYTEWVDKGGDIPGYYKCPCRSHRMTLRRTSDDVIRISIDEMDRYGSPQVPNRRLMVFPIVENEDIPAMINVTGIQNEYLLGYITRKPDEFYFFEAIDRNSQPGEDGYIPNPDIIIKPFLGINTYFVRVTHDDDRAFGVVNVKDNYYCLGLYNDNDMLDEDDPDDAALIDWEFYPLRY